MVIPSSVKHIDFYRAIKKTNSKVKIESKYNNVFLRKQYGYGGNSRLYWVGAIVISKKRFAKCFDFSKDGEEKAHKFVEEIRERYIATSKSLKI